MNVADLLHSGRPTLSFEIFPPKKNTNFPSVKKAAKDIAEIEPDFISITYGASGGTSPLTRDLSLHVQQQGVPALAHLTCVSSTKEEIYQELEGLQNSGIRSVLALRGDLPPGMKPEDSKSYRYAAELISDLLRSRLII